MALDQPVDASSAVAQAVGVRQLFHVYCQRIDQGTPEDLSRLFAPDARLVLAFDRGRVLAGRDAICQWFAGYMTETRQRSRPNRHWIAGLRLPDPLPRADFETFVDASGLRRDEPLLETYRGHYRDTVSLRDGRWFLQDREIHLWDACATSAVVRLGEPPPYPRLAMRVWSYDEAARRDFSDLLPPAMPTSDSTFDPPVRYPADWLDSDGVPVPSEAEAFAMLEAEQALNRLAQAFDAPDAAGFTALLTPDARLDLDGDATAATLRGPAAIAAWHAARRSDERRQLLVPVVRVAGDQAEILAYLTIDNGADERAPEVNHVQGRWEARLHRDRAGAWRVAALRELHFFSHRSLPRVASLP